MYGPLQYKIDWKTNNTMTSSIKRGDRFYCDKDVVMNTEEIAYIQGKIYVSEKDGCLTDEQGIIEHFWDSYWTDYFIPAPHPVENCDCDKCELVKKADYYQAFKKEAHKHFKETVNKIDRDYFQSVQEEFAKDSMNNLQEKSNEAFFGKRTFETGAVRDSNKGKPFIHTLLGYTRQRFGYHMAKNADKYGPLNFMKGIPTEAALESLDRHLAAYMAGDRSEDHLSAIIFGVQLCMLNEEKDGVEANEYFNV